MEKQIIHAVYLPVSYEVNTGSVELSSLQEGFTLAGLKKSDVISLPLPRATVYMSRKLQRARSPAKENRGASLVVQTAGLKGIGIWGPVLVVNDENKYAALPEEPSQPLKKRARTKKV